MKNDEILFDVCDSEGILEIAVTSEKDWIKNHFQSDVCTDNVFLLSNFEEIMENVFIKLDGDNRSKEEITKFLLDAGFKQNKEFNAFMENIREDECDMND